MPQELPHRDYHDLVALALALATDHPCPFCQVTAWKSVKEPVGLPIAEKLAPSVPVVCGECGYVHLFMCSYLEQKARRMNAENN